MESSSKISKEPNQGKSYFNHISLEDYLNGYKVPAVKNKQEAFYTMMEKINHQPPKAKQTHFRYFFTIGSILAAACFILFFLFLNTPSTTFINQQSTELVHFLPDNSRVILAPGAQISYSKTFEKRTVMLKGTAYFEVEKGSKFSVKTGLGVVQVIGTRFLVDEKNGKWMVACFEGSVRVNSGKEVRQLFEKQAVELQNNRLQQIEENREEYPELAYFKRSYYNEPMTTICSDLEQYFGIQIELSALKPHYFSGAFYNANPDTLLEILCTTFELDFQKTATKKYTIISQDPI